MTDGDFFMVDVDALSGAIGSVSTERDNINAGVTAMRGTISQIEQVWQGPAAGSFVTLAANFNSITDKLTGLLDEAIGRMQAARDTYVQTETGNTTNWAVDTGGSGPGPDQNQGNDGTGDQPATMVTGRTPPSIATNQTVAPPALTRPDARS